MAKVEIEDPCFAPRKTKWVEYSGADPLAIARDYRSVFRNCFEVGTSSTGEPRWMWDWSGDPIQLYVHWVANKRYSRWSTFWISVRTVAFKSKSRNEGSFRMEVEPLIKHEFSGSRSLIWLYWMYWYVFYNRVRQGMLERCREMAEKFISIVKETYEIGTLRTE